jgi:hypothetical protein
MLRPDLSRVATRTRDIADNRGPDLGMATAEMFLGGVSYYSPVNAHSHLITGLVVTGALGVSSLVACDCMAPPVREALRISAAVFTGKVVKKKELPTLARGRQRYEVYFTVGRQWKGLSSSEIVVYDAAPRGDCEGFGFEIDKEYVVFAHGWTVKEDVKLDVPLQDLTYHDIWNDVLPVGTEILVGRICTRTGEITSAESRRVIRQLGRARALAIRTKQVEIANSFVVGQTRLAQKLYNAGVRDRQRRSELRKPG